VVWHEAVRDYGKLQCGRGALDLRTNETDGAGLFEQSMPLMCAEREEILVQTDVVEGLQVFGVHAREGANGGPAEAGPHVLFWSG